MVTHFIRNLANDVRVNTKIASPDSLIRLGSYHDATGNRSIPSLRPLRETYRAIAASFDWSALANRKVLGVQLVVVHTSPVLYMRSNTASPRNIDECIWYNLLTPTLKYTRTVFLICK